MSTTSIATTSSSSTSIPIPAPNFPTNLIPVNPAPLLEYANRKLDYQQEVQSTSKKSVVILNQLLHVRFINDLMIRNAKWQKEKNKKRGGGEKKDGVFGEPEAKKGKKEEEQGGRSTEERIVEEEEQDEENKENIPPAGFMPFHVAPSTESVDPPTKEN